MNDTYHDVKPWWKYYLDLVNLSFWLSGEVELCALVSLIEQMRVGEGRWPYE